MNVKAKMEVPKECLKYRLSFEDYNSVCSLVAEAKKSITIDGQNYSKAFETAIPIIKKYFSSSKVEQLQKNRDLLDVDVYAVKLDKNKPEIYFIFANGKFRVADQSRCDMYS